MKLTTTAATSIAALSLVGTLAGCAAAADAPASTDSGATTSGDYTDGDYTASGNYTSPNGQEEISVNLTLADNVITAVTVTGEPSGPDATRYQGQFEDNIAAEVVGKNIDEISVDKVAGSSLTSAGFNDAIDAIKADAAS